MARHAKASAAAVSLRSLDGGLQLAVTDAGAGFINRQHLERPTLGLASMEERVRLLGDGLNIQSTPRQGTIVVAWVPMKQGQGLKAKVGKRGRISSLATSLQPLAFSL